MLDVTNIPRLTVSTELMQAFEDHLRHQQDKVESWFEAQWQLTPPPVYGSVDLRNAGFKLAPVDMNLFPAGFNNLVLNPDFLPLSIEAAKVAIMQAAPHAERILIIPESHTRNLFYWESMRALLRILTEAGFNVRLGSLAADLAEAQTITLTNGDLVKVEPIQRQGEKLAIDHFVPDVILLNNDLSDGIPALLQGIEQRIVPPAELGWSRRLKSGHFQHYAAVSDEFAKLLQIDPWFIAPLFLHCGEVDFMRREGEACVAEHVETLLVAIQKKYTEYGITQSPYIVIKADAGTYGMAVMMVRSPEEVLALNRKQRTHMSKSKGGHAVNSVIIQEGVYSFETLGASHAVTEPVVYLWGQRAVGGFYRVHTGKGIDENLNSPGMHFEPLVFPKGCNQPLDRCFYAYGVVARLSMLAAARELQS